VVAPQTTWVPTTANAASLVFNMLFVCLGRNCTPNRATVLAVYNSVIANPSWRNGMKSAFLVALAFFGVALLQAAEVERIAVVEGCGYFPVAIRLRSGEILAVLRGGGAHIGRGGRLDLVLSRDGGKSWSKPWTAIDGPEDDRNPALGQLSDGTILLAYAVLSGYDSTGLKLRGGRKDWVFDGAYVMRSSDKGRTWTKPELSGAIHSFYAGQGAVSPFGKIAQLKDGTVVMPVYFEFYDARGNESYVFRSTDGGKTWGEPSLLGKHYNETAVVPLRDGRLLAAMRSEKGGHIATTESADGGRSWSEPRQLTQDREHPGDLIQLKSGDVLLTYGERNKPMGARAVWSKDGGRTWDTEHPVVLADDAPNTDTGYPSSVEVGKGRIVSLYYQVDDLKNVPQSAKCKAALWQHSK
jgi:Neuraminidase (sialidase)